MNDPQPLGTARTMWQRVFRRKLGPWGIAYVAAAWGFLQGLEYVGEAFGWPGYLRRVAILLLLTGLPMVLVIAWYHGERGRQRIPRSEILILGALLVLGGAMTWRFHDAGDAAVAPAIASPDATEAPPVGFNDPRPSIAVLPFENRSAVSEDAFFADGMHDDLLTRLARIGALRVIARSSVTQLRGTRLGTREIGTALGVRNVLFGAVQRAADRVRISVQLIDTEQEAQLWAESFDRELSAANIFDIQGEVATAIAAALKIALTGSAQSLEPAIPTQNLAAWEAFQRGEAAGPEDAVAFFQRAVDLDPKFARAHAALAQSLSRQVFALGARRDVVLPRAEAAVEAALLLDPGLAEAWVVLGNITFDERAEPAYRKAVELNPNFAPGWEHLSDLQREDGHWEEALDYAERAAALDPLSVGINESLAASYASLGRFDQAELYYRKVVELDPTLGYGQMQLAHFLAYVRNQFAEALMLAERAVTTSPDEAVLPAQLASLYQDLGDDVSARRLLEKGLQRWPDRTNLLASHAWLSMRQGNQIAAVRAARRLLDATPTHGGAILLLARVDMQRKDYPAARARFADAYPGLLAESPPVIDRTNYGDAVSLAAILLKTGEIERAKQLLDASEAVLKTMPRLGSMGFGITDVMIHALRGDRVQALAGLRTAVEAGWRGPYLRIILELSPALAAIRREPEFKAIVATIEADMARQRAELAERRSAAPASGSGGG